MQTFHLKTLLLTLLVASGWPVAAQQYLTLEQCRTLALDNNKLLKARALNQQAAEQYRRAARTDRLPKVDVVAGYTLTSREVQLLSSSQQQALAGLGTASVEQLGTLVQQLVVGGVLSPQEAQALGQQLQRLSPVAEQLGNHLGERINNALRTDTRQLWVGTVMVRQPIYLGGAIKAENNVADLKEMLANDVTDLTRQNIIYGVDQAYWTAVSLQQKRKLAQSYRELVGRLSHDVQQMVKQGVATRADGLKVDVRVNEADMQTLQVENGLSLAQMLLCQLCGLPLDSEIKLADEDAPQVVTSTIYEEGDTTATAPFARPEIRMLQRAVDMRQEAVRLQRAAFLPHIFALGGYTVTNPNVYNGFQRRFGGVWSVGLTVQVPIWNWMEGRYRIRAAKAEASMAQLDMKDTQEKISLQVAQARFKQKEAYKRLHMAEANLKSADENLRCANVGFKEGVMDVTDVMAAQTAWQKAQTDQIDAQVALRMSTIELKKAKGQL